MVHLIESVVICTCHLNQSDSQVAASMHAYDENDGWRPILSIAFLGFSFSSVVVTTISAAKIDNGKLGMRCQTHAGFCRLFNSLVRAKHKCLYKLDVTHKLDNGNGYSTEEGNCASRRSIVWCRQVE